MRSTALAVSDRAGMAVLPIAICGRGINSPQADVLHASGVVVWSLDRVVAHACDVLYRIARASVQRRRRSDLAMQATQRHYAAVAQW